MAREAEFAEFAANFADRLVRFAALLTARHADPTGEDVDAARALTTRALLAVRRRWREVTTGTPPETLAAAAVARYAARQRTPLAAPIAAPDNPETPDEDLDQQLRAALHAAWVRLPPRVRLAILAGFADLLFPWLIGTDVTAFAPRRGANSADVGLRVLTEAIEPIARRHDIPSSGLLDRFLPAVLQERAAWPPNPVGIVDDVIGRFRRQRRLGGIVTAGCLAGLLAVAAVVSRLPAGERQARPSPSPTPRPVASAGAVVNWPLRGNAASDLDVVVQLRQTFREDHPQAYGPVQVLLLSDVASIRLAFVVAHSPEGVVNAWYYGPIGSRELVEGYSSYGTPLPARSNPPAFAALVADPNGRAVLVALVAPGHLVAELEDATGESGVRFTVPDGALAVDVTSMYSSQGVVRLLAPGPVWEGVPFTVQLTARPVASVLARFPGGQGAEMIPVQRGHADAGELFRALAVLDAWRRTSELGSPAAPVVLWGGDDGFGTQLLVLRAKTLHRPDLLVVVWGRGPEDAGEYLLAPDIPDYPMAFSYPGSGTSHIGVLVPVGVARVGLYVRGAVRMTAEVGATGFASLPAEVSPTTLADGYATLLLYDRQGREVGRTAVPPPV